MELCPFSAAEIYNSDPLGYNNDKLWFRGSFPGSYLAENDSESWQWRAVVNRCVHGPPCFSHVDHFLSFELGQSLDPLEIQF